MLGPGARHPSTVGDVDDTEPDIDSERGALLVSLRVQRAHVQSAFDDLPEEVLRRPLLPSGWTYLGLLQHLALDVERFWFQHVVAGEDVDLPQGDEAWQVSADRSPAEVLDLYRREVDISDRIIRRLPLDAEPLAWPTELFGDMPARVLRRTILHVITETATHAGQLDAARELVDGKQWLVLTD
jgi:hypothetical protein